MWPRLVAVLARVAGSRDRATRGEDRDPGLLRTQRVDDHEYRAESCRSRDGVPHGYVLCEEQQVVRNISRPPQQPSVQPIRVARVTSHACIAKTCGHRCVTCRVLQTPRHFVDGRNLHDIHRGRVDARCKMRLCFQPLAPGCCWPITTPAFLRPCAVCSNHRVRSWVRWPMGLR